jgi:acyl-CoA reductase-like NAD-dependent aldehyde dehydrogenase
VHASIQDKLLSTLKTALKALPYLDDSIAEDKIGDMAWEEGRPMVLQPVVCKSQYEKIIKSMDGAKMLGIKTLTGGGARKEVDLANNKIKGYYIEPTVFIDVPQGARFINQSIYGRILC